MLVATAIVAARNAPRADNKPKPPTVDPALLKQIPEPHDPNVYGLSTRRDFHYTLPYMQDSVLYAARSVASVFEDKPKQATVICDCSDITGDTPRGRHPGDAHDNGNDMDITYYLNKTVQNPSATNEVDFIVCENHSGAHCTKPGEAKYLDVHRQAEFFAALAKLDLAFKSKTGLPLIERMAVDRRVEEVLTPEIQQMMNEDCGFTKQELEHTLKLVYSEPLDTAEDLKAERRIPNERSWARTHHSHAHLRFYSFNNNQVELMSSHVRALVTALEKQT